MGVGGQHQVPTALLPGKDPVPIVQEAGWAPGPVWKGAENLPPTGTLQPVASRYTDWAIPAAKRNLAITQTCAYRKTFYSSKDVNFKYLY